MIMANTSASLGPGGTTYSVGWFNGIDDIGRLRGLVSLGTHSHSPFAKIVANLAHATQHTAEKARPTGYRATEAYASSLAILATAMLPSRAPPWDKWCKF